MKIFVCTREVMEASPIQKENDTITDCEIHNWDVLISTLAME